MNNEKKYLLGLTLAELKQVAKDLGMPAFTGGQMAKWLYEQHVKSIRTSAGEAPFPRGAFSPWR